MNPHAFLQHLASNATLTVRESLILGAVVAEPGIGVKELHASLGLVKAAISRAKDMLAEHDLVTFDSNPKDRRLVRITPTAAGRNLWADAVRAAEKAAVRRAA